VAVVDEGRGEAKVGGDLPSLTAEGIVGAVLSVIHGRMTRGDSGSVDASARRAGGGPRMGELTNPLMSMIVMPYLGPAAARRELERSVPKLVMGQRPHAPSNPLKAVEMRLTYRTVRVLVAVAANPGSSNRVVAEVSGVADQGQISKLLGRLERLGLIENTDAVSTRGGSNAWSLTKTGWEVHSAITAAQAPS
jgi:DNA-binding MarR family transcriptional regulator